MTTLLPNPTPAPLPPEDGSDTDKLAFDKTADLRNALEVENCPQYSLDAYYAVGKVAWTAPRVRVYRDRMLALPEFSIDFLDRFEELATALRFVQANLLRLIQRARQIPAIAAEGWRVRSLLMSYAEALSQKGKIDPALIVRLREGSGYRDLVKDLDVLVLELRGLPASYTSPEAVVTRADLARASEIAREIHVHVGNDADADLSQEKLLEARRKLATLLLEAHSQLRRAVTFLRWREGDATTLVPSLFVPGGPRKTPDVAGEVPSDLAVLHEQLHAAEGATTEPVHPEDNPFSAE